MSLENKYHYYQGFTMALVIVFILAFIVFILSKTMKEKDIDCEKARKFHKWILIGSVIMCFISYVLLRPSKESIKQEQSKRYDSEMEYRFANL